MPFANQSSNEQDETSLKEIEELLSCTVSDSEGEIPRNHARVTSVDRRGHSVALRISEKSENYEESTSNVYRRMVPLIRFNPNLIRINNKK